MKLISLNQNLFDFKYIFPYLCYKKYVCANKHDWDNYVANYLFEYMILIDKVYPLYIESDVAGIERLIPKLQEKWDQKNHHQLLQDLDKTNRIFHILQDPETLPNVGLWSARSLLPHGAQFFTVEFMSIRPFLWLGRVRIVPVRASSWLFDLMPLKERYLKNLQNPNTPKHLRYDTYFPNNPPTFRTLADLK